MCGWDGGALLHFVAFDSCGSDMLTFIPVLGIHKLQRVFSLLKSDCIDVCAFLFCLFDTRQNWSLLTVSGLLLHVSVFNTLSVQPT